MQEDEDFDGSAKDPEAQDFSEITEALSDEDSSSSDSSDDDNASDEKQAEIKKEAVKTEPGNCVKEVLESETEFMQAHVGSVLDFIVIIDFAIEPSRLILYVVC